MFYTYLTPDNKHLIDFSMDEFDCIEFKIKDYSFSYCIVGPVVIKETIPSQRIRTEFGENNIHYQLCHSRLRININLFISNDTRKVEYASIVNHHNNRIPKRRISGAETVLLHYLFLLQTGQIDKRLNYQFPLNYL